MRKTILMVGHVNEITGPGHHLRDFLVNLPNTKSYVLFHPLIGTNVQESTLYLYKSGESNPVLLAKYPKRMGFFLQLVSDMLLTFRWILGIPRKIDFYVGINNFDTFPALFFKGWKIKKVIYYGSDYADFRFKNIFTNVVYRIIERLDVGLVDFVVSNTSRSEKRRIEIGLSPERSIVVPNGVDLGLVSNLKKRPVYRFVFQGHISLTHGIMDVLKSFKELSKKYRSIKLAILGVGPALENVEHYVRRNKLEQKVRILGRYSHEDTLKFLYEKCEVGIASYNTYEGWTRYASPLKVKEYLACQLAVIISNVPEVAEDIEKLKMGIVYSKPRELYRAMERFCVDRELTRLYVANSRKYIQEFDWEKMFKKRLLPYFI